MFLDVKRSPQPSVVLCGPSTAVNVSGGRFNNREVSCERLFLGDTIEVILTARDGTDKLQFMKASLLEEVFKHGFKLQQNAKISDDSLVLSREVSLFNEWFDWVLMWIVN